MTDDIIIPFQVGAGAVRGRIIRLGPAVDAILKPHDFPAPVSELLGETIVLTALMGSSLKFDGKLIFQAQGDGPVRLLVADYVSDGAMRATASVQSEIKARGLAALVGKGHIALTIDQGPDMDRYQGVTALEGATLEEAAVGYFDQSEQIPTAIRLAVGRSQRAGEAEGWRAGGVMIQHVPQEGGSGSGGDDEAWERAAVLLKTTQADELIDPGLAPETLLYRLFHEDGVRVFEAKSVKAECRCNAGKIAAVLSRYSEAELKDLLEGDAIAVNCEFCRKTYHFDERGNALPR